MRAAAEALAAWGMALFPLTPRDKIPLAGTHGCLDATAELERIRAWWTQQPNANIGLATCAKSGVWVLDIDGDVGEQTLRELEQRMGLLPETVEVITGNGGRHVYFKLPDFDEAPSIKNTAGKLGQGLDTRGDGGYVVAPPSIHPSGKAYYWSVDSGSEFAAAPVWLIGLVSAPPAVTQLDDFRPQQHWTALARDGVSEGSRNTTIASMAGRYLARGIHPAEVNELLLAWNIARNRPPLPDAEVTNIVKSIAMKEFRRRGAQQNG